MMRDIRSMYPDEIREYLTRVPGQPAYRAGQIFQWLHGGELSSFNEMSNLPLSLRERLEEEFDIIRLRQEEKYVSALDGTAKYLFSLEEGSVIESVLMEYHHGSSVCISSQAGCAMGCAFCASAVGGLERNLRASEMLDQLYRIRQDSGVSIHSVVVMGTGEPLENFENLIRFIALASHKSGLNISRRNITVSTCGIVPKIYELASLRLPITLAISLHAPEDELRMKIMPVAKRWSIEEIVRACDYYQELTGRRITYEYSLMRGFNDSPAHARDLADLLKGRDCHINLIPVNPVRESSYKRPDRSALLKFKTILEKSGRNVTIRREIGSDISAACGQLRRKYTESISK